MGSQQSSLHKQEAYTYLLTHNDPRYGPCKVFKGSLPQEFCYQIHLNVMPSNIALLDQSFGHFMTNYLIDGERWPMLRIFNYSIGFDGNTLENKIVGSCKMPQIKIWLQFLRHNLRDFLHWRKAECQPLRMDEIIMAISKAIRAQELTKNNQILGVSLKLQDISITIDGQMKFNPLSCQKTVRKFINSSSAFVNKTSQASLQLKQRILEKRLVRQWEKQSLSTTNSNTLIHKHEVQSAAHLSEQIQFLIQLKKFANQLTCDSTCIAKDRINPEDNMHSQERKQIKRLLFEIHKAKSLKQVKKIIGEPFADKFIVDFSRTKHLQLERKFQHILNELECKSQRTEYGRQVDRPSIRRSRKHTKEQSNLSNKDFSMSYDNLTY